MDIPKLLKIDVARQNVRLAVWFSLPTSPLTRAASLVSGPYDSMSFIFLLAFLAACRGDRPGELSSMLTQLAHGASGCEDRILVALDAQGDRGQWVRSQSVLFEHSLLPIFNVLPKTSNRLSKEVARYALHWAFVDGRGWIVKGLEESKVYSNSSTPLQSGLAGDIHPDSHRNPLVLSYSRAQVCCRTSSQRCRRRSNTATA